MKTLELLLPKLEPGMRVMHRNKKGNWTCVTFRDHCVCKDSVNGAVLTAPRGNEDEYVYTKPLDVIVPATVVNILRSNLYHDTMQIIPVRPGREPSEILVFHKISNNVCPYQLDGPESGHKEFETLEQMAIHLWNTYF